MAVTDDGAGGDLFPETILTDRLRLERLGPENPDPLRYYEHTRLDAPDIEETTEYVSWSPNRTPHAGVEFLRYAAESWEEREDATYLVRPREGEDGAGAFAGTTGIGVDWDRDRGVLGIWLRKPFWGRGYSGERADALFELAFERLDLSVVAVSHLPDNENSERAITEYVDRHGGRRAGRFRNRLTDADGSVHDTIEYSVTQSEWRAADGAETVIEFHD